MCVCHSERSEESTLNENKISRFTRNDTKKTKLFLTGIALFFLFATSKAQTTDTSYISRPQDTLKVFASDTAIKYSYDTIQIANTIIDTTNGHSPKRAALLSALLPGAGQFYNKKYWKIPVLYAGFGACGYLILKKNQSMDEYKNAYIIKTDSNSTLVDPFPNSTKGAILEAYTSYRKSRDLMVIVTAALYAINIIDATVDAHLFTFDVTDDLSLNIKPTFFSDHAYLRRPGLMLTIKL